jgi:hypothetical protein
MKKTLFFLGSIVLLIIGIKPLFNYGKTVEYSFFSFSVSKFWYVTINLLLCFALFINYMKLKKDN